MNPRKLLRGVAILRVNHEVSKTSAFFFKKKNVTLFFSSLGRVFSALIGCFVGPLNSNHMALKGHSTRRNKTKFDRKCERVAGVNYKGS